MRARGPLSGRLSRQSVTRSSRWNVQFRCRATGWIESSSDAADAAQGGSGAGESRDHHGVGLEPAAISRKGAVGLMQLIPGTAQRFGVGNPFDPAQNVEGGTIVPEMAARSLQRRLDEVARGLQCRRASVDRIGGVPAYPETQHYVQKVTDAYFRPDSGRNLDALESSEDLECGRKWNRRPCDFHERMNRLVKSTNPFREARTPHDCRDRDVSLYICFFACASPDKAGDARQQFAVAVRMRTMLEGYLEKDRSASDYK